MNRQFRRMMKKEGYVPATAKDVMPNFRAAILNQIPPGRRGEFESHHREGITVDSIVSVDDPVFLGAVVGHWLVGPTRISKKNGNSVHICISYCGCVAMYEPWVIAGGKLPKSCIGCRPGEHEAPPFHATVPERDMSILREFWRDAMSTAFAESVRINGKDARTEWGSLGRPVLADVCDSAGYGRDFGWKVIVFGCAEKPNLKQDRSVIRWKATHLSMRQIEIMIRPAGSNFEYQVQLSTGRSDYKFADVADRIKAIIDSRADKETKWVETPAGPVAIPTVAAAATSPTAAPATSENGHVSRVVNVEALSKLAGNLDRVIKYARDMNEMAGLKHAAAEKFKAASERAAIAYGILVGAQQERDDAKSLLNAHQDRIADLEKKMRLEIQLREEASRNHTAKLAAADAAMKEYEPLEAAAEAAKKEVNELDRMEAEGAKQLGDAKNLEVLLAALSKVG